MTVTLRSLILGKRLLALIVVSFLLSGVAHAQYWSIHEAQPGGFRANATLSSMGTTSFTINTPYPDPQHRDFRVFIPPGTFSVSLTFNSSSTAWVGTASRADAEPSGNYTGITTGSFLSLPWAGDDGASLDRLKSADYLARNVGGHGTIAYSRSSQVTQTGMWLYSKLIETDGAIVNVHPTITVHKDTFLAWFNSVKDNNSCWDNMGNPIACGSTPPPSGTATLSGKLFTGVTGQTTGISGASLYVTNQISGTRVQTVVTNSSGNYQFTNLEPNKSYYIHIEPNSATDANKIMPFTTQVNSTGIFVGPLVEGVNTKNIELTVPNCLNTTGSNNSTIMVSLTTDVLGWEVPIRDPTINVMKDGVTTIPSSQWTYNNETGLLSVTNLDNGNYTVMLARSGFDDAYVAFSIDEHKTSYSKDLKLTYSGSGGIDVNCGDTAGLDDVIKILQILTDLR